LLGHVRGHTFFGAVVQLSPLYTEYLEQGGCCFCHTRKTFAPPFNRPAEPVNIQALLFLQSMANLNFVPSYEPPGFDYHFLLLKNYTLEEVVDEFGARLTTDDYERLSPGYRRFCSSKEVNACKLKLWKDANGGQTEFKRGDDVYIPGEAEAVLERKRQQRLDRCAQALAAKYGCTPEYVRAWLH
jgi:hypothetical protein